MPKQNAVTPDETGWRIGGLPAWLHAFAARRITVLCHRSEARCFGGREHLELG